MGAIPTLVLIGFLALVFAISDYLGESRKAAGTPDKRTAIAQDLARLTLQAEIGIAALAWIAAGVLKLRGIDIPAASLQKLLTIASAALGFLGGPGIYVYITWKQSQFTRQHRLPDGTLSQKDARVIQRASTFKNLLLVFLTGSSLLLLLFLR